jgi:hypothetical protein
MMIRTLLMPLYCHLIVPLGSLHLHLWTLKSIDLTPSVSFFERSPVNISLMLGNWWYSMEIHNHLRSKLFLSFLSHLWIGSFHNLKQPIQKCLDCSNFSSFHFFFPLFKSRTSCSIGTYFGTRPASSSAPWC